MSNKTTLQTNNNKLNSNNTDLASILNTINNLPEAGSSGGDTQYVINTIQHSYQEVTSGTTMFSVTGLGFTPKFVYIGVQNSTMSISSNDSQEVFSSAIGGYLNASNTVRGDGSTLAGTGLALLTVGKNLVSINMTTDGFDVVANTDIAIYARTFQYIAIG